MGKLILFSDSAKASLAGAEFREWHLVRFQGYVGPVRHRKRSLFSLQS